MAKGRILLAHGNTDCQKIYGSVLVYDGYDVDIADNVDSAMIRVAALHYDLVISDLYLPSSGDECLIRRLRVVVGSHLPVVIMTGWITEPHRSLAIVEGAERFLPIPIKPRELVTIVAELLGQRPALPPELPVNGRLDPPVATGI